MDTWFSKSLGDGLTAAEPLQQIEEHLRLRCMHDAAAAVFVREVSGDVQCEITVFFSPSLRNFAESIGAVSCAAPLRRGLSLFVGTEASWSALFPAREV